MLNLHLLFFKMGISHSEGLEKKRGSKSLGNTPMKTNWFSAQVEKSEPRVQSCFLPDPPPITPPSPGKSWHKGLKQNCPSSQFPLLCQRWPSAAEPSMCQRWGRKRMGQRRRGQPQSCSRALQSRSGSRDSLTLRFGRFASAPAVDGSRYQSDYNRQSRGSWRAAISHSAEGTGSAKGNYWVLGVEFPDLTTLLKYNRGLLK